MKKIIILGIIMLGLNVKTVLAYENYTNNNGIVMSEIEIANLKNLGFSLNEIATMDIETFNANKDIEAELVSMDTKYIKTVYKYSPKNNTLNLKNYNTMLNDLRNNPDDYQLVNVENYEITEEEYNADNDNVYSPFDVNPAIYQTESKKLTTTISYISSLQQYRLKNELNWKTSPKTRSNDLFGIGGPSSTQIPVAGSEYAGGSWIEYDSCRNTNSYKSANYTSSGRWFKQGGGYAVFFGIPQDYHETITYNNYYGNLTYPCVDTPAYPKGTVQKLHQMKNMTFTFYYNVAKQNSGSTVNAFGSYQHAAYSIDINANLGLTVGTSGLGGAFNISASFSQKFDGMGGTHAQVLNPVW